MVAIDPFLIRLSVAKARAGTCSGGHREKTTVFDGTFRDFLRPSP
jgi:hypothetical protein